MVSLSPIAQGHLDDLILHYELKGRPAATRNLMAAVEAARRRIGRSPAAGLTAPRTYPKLKRPGLKWVHEKSYWFAYTYTDEAPAIIVGIYYDKADIPGRL